MPAKRQQEGDRHDEREHVFQQVEDDRGRMRLDRPFTAAEAAEQDRENLERLGLTRGVTVVERTRRAW